MEQKLRYSFNFLQLILVMNRNSKRVFQSIFMLFITLLGFSSCIKEDLDDCPSIIRVRFDYSYNMLSENLFGEQVEMVALYVFDDQGVLVTEKSVTSKFDHDSYIELTGLPKGSYKLVSWSRSIHLKEDKSNFVIPQLTIGRSTLNDLSYYLEVEDNTYQNELNHHLVGHEDFSVSGGLTCEEVTIYYKKVTNKIKLVVYSNNGTDFLNAEDLECSVIDEVGNHHINYDYELKEKGRINYLPYYAGNEEFKPETDNSLSTFAVSKYAAVSQFSVSRLIESNDPKVVIKKKESQTPIMQISIPEYVKLASLEGHANEWSLQEYLDRQDEYLIVVYLGATTWTTIIINGWVINNIEIGV